MLSPDRVGALDARDSQQGSRHRYLRGAGVEMEPAPLVAEYRGILGARLRLPGPNLLKGCPVLPERQWSRHRGPPLTGAGRPAPTRRK